MSHGSLSFFLLCVRHMRQPGFASNLAGALQALELGDARLRVTPRLKAGFTNGTTLYRFIIHLQAAGKEHL
jgi:hypothetical protein